MAKQEIRSAGEFYLTAFHVDCSTVGTVAHLPFPVRCKVNRILAVCEVAPAGANTLTARLHGNRNLKNNGTSASKTLQAGDIAGDITVLEFSPTHSDNCASAAIDGDALARDSCLELRTTGGNAATYTFLVVCRPD